MASVLLTNLNGFLSLAGQYAGSFFNETDRMASLIKAGVVALLASISVVSVEGACRLAVKRATAYFM